MSIIVNYPHIQEAFEKNPDQFQASVYDSITKVSGGDSAEHASLLASWNEALASFKSEKSTPGVMSTPRNALASRLQSLLATKSKNANKLNTLQTPQRSDVYNSPLIQEVKFDPFDFAGWIGLEGKKLFAPDKAPWVIPSPTPQSIDDNATIALFSDWGTGLYGAPIISKSITELSRCDVALHLGDTYYSGAQDEITNQLKGDWPQRDSKTINRAMCGNHEMYSDGVAYFAVLESFFHQSASCFAMQNTNWLIVCFDSTYIDFDIDPAQVTWLESIINAAGTRKVILISHYQPFSYFEPQGTKLQKALMPLLSSQRIHAWFWGHEHRLVMYEPHTSWGFKGRCIGHGGFPNFRDALGVPRSDTYEWVNLKAQPFGLPAAKVLDGPNFWVTSYPTDYSPHGFVLLEFDGSSAFETYKTPDNIAVTERMVL